MSHRVQPDGLACARLERGSSSRACRTALLAAVAGLGLLLAGGARADERIGTLGLLPRPGAASATPRHGVSPAAVTEGDPAVSFDGARKASGATSPPRMRQGLREADAIQARGASSDSALSTAADCPVGTNLVVTGRLRYAPAGCSDESVDIQTSAASTCSSLQGTPQSGAAPEALLGCTDLPLRGARVELYQVGFDEPAGVTSTGEDGAFLLCMINDSDNQTDIFVSVRTCGDQGAPICSDPGPFPVVVTDASNTIYATTSSVVRNVCTGSVDWDMTDRRSVTNGAQAIFDLLANRAGDVLANEVQWPRDARLQVRFPDTSTAFSPGSGIVHVASGDEQDPSRILGPYGIAVLQRLYGGTLPPTPSCSGVSWTSHTSPGCAWVIGWADFLAAAILGDPVLRDTTAPGQAPSSRVDLEGPDPPAAGRDVRGAVAATLWDVADDGVEAWDPRLSFGLPGVWLATEKRPSDICAFERSWAGLFGSFPWLPAILAHHGIDCRFGLDAVDPVVDGRSDLGAPANLVLSNRVVRGVAADGVTPVVLRYWAPGPGKVTFRISDDPLDSPDRGTLSSLGGNERAATVVVATQREEVLPYHVALAVFTAPPDYARTDFDRLAPHRTVRVDATYEPSSGEDVEEALDLEIHRPPVLLLHGWNGSSETWAGWRNVDLPLAADYEFQDEPNFVVYVHEYGKRSREAIRDIEEQAQQGVSGALQRLRRRGVAATRADVVAHSLGGLLTRVYVAGPAYRRPADFWGGDVNRLITLDTPHLGSALANAVVDESGLDPTLLGLIANAIGFCVECGAAGDMRTDSVRVTHLRAAEVPAHALVGIGGRELLADVPTIAALLSRLPWGPTRILSMLLEGVDLLELSLFGPIEKHDLVVGEPSQRGRLAPANVSTPFNLDELGLGIHFTVNREDRVRERVVDLLYRRVSDPLFAAAGFPAAPPSPASMAGSLPAARPMEVTTGITITQPSPETVVAVDQLLRIAAAPAPDFPAAKVLFVSPLGSVIDHSSPFEVDLTVPSDLAGAIDLHAFAVDTAGRFAESGPVRIHVSNPAALTELSVNPTQIFLHDYAPTQSLRVDGAFDNGSERNLDGATSGTTYATDDPEIATVNEEGTVVAVGIGETLVVVRNGDLEATAPVVVLSTPELSSCPQQPSAQCARAERASLHIRDAALDDRDQIRWEFRSRERLDEIDLGDPIGARSYSLCLYDDRDSLPKLIAALPVRPGAEWRRRGSEGFIYRDGSARQRGVRRVRLTTDGAGGTRISIIASGEAVPIPAPVGVNRLLAQDGHVQVQLINDETSTCWASEFATAARNDVSRFRARFP